MSEVYLKAAIIWEETVLDEQTFQKPQVVSVGQNTKKSTFAIDEQIVGAAFPLFQPIKDGGYQINLIKGMDGDITVDGEELTLNEFIEFNCQKQGKTYSGVIKPFDSGYIDIGEITIGFGFVKEAPPVIMKGKRQLDTTLLKSLGIAAAVHLALIILMFLTGGDGDELTLDDIPDRFAKMIIEEPEKEDEKPEIKNVAKVGKRMGGKEGRVGSPDRPKYVKTKIPKARYKEIVKNIKNRGAVGAVKKMSFAGMLPGGNDINTRLKSTGAASFSGDSGNELDGHGTGGTSFRGTGTGGGGTGYGRVGGQGDIDTGGGSGTKVRLGKGRKKERKVSVKRSGAVNIGGFCKKSDIQRVVARKGRAIRYCYEKELQRFRNLKGKIKVKWIIGLTGKVEKVTIIQDSIKNRRMNSCIKRKIKRWRFKKPKGGKCVIAFPFLFRAD